ncbi:hypothetical protein Tco_1368403 [Tanacetum coccineum]
MKQSSMNKFNALNTTIQHLSNKNFPVNLGLQRAFHRLFGEEERTFKFELTQNMKNLEAQLNKETLHVRDSMSTFKMINAQFQEFIHSELLKIPNYEHDAREAREDFKQYTYMEVLSFKDSIVQNMNSIKKCIVERVVHAQAIQKWLKRLNDRKLQIQDCKVQEVKALDASLVFIESSRIDSRNEKNSSGNDSSSTGNESISYGNESNNSGKVNSLYRNETNTFENDTNADATDITPSYDIEPMVEVLYTADYNVFYVETQHTEQPENMNDTSLMVKVDNNTTPESLDMCNNEIEAENPKDECALLASLIANFKLNLDENKKSQRQLKKANTSITQELNKSKQDLEKTKQDLEKSKQDQ